MQITSSRKILISLNKRSEDKNGLVKKKKWLGKAMGFRTHIYLICYCVDVLNDIP